MITERQKAITFGLIRLLYETESIEAGEQWSGTEGYEVLRRAIIKVPDMNDDQSCGYELFSTKLNNENYIGVHRLFYGEFGENEGIVDGLVIYFPDHRYVSFQRLIDEIDALITEEFWH